MKKIFIAILLLILPLTSFASLNFTNSGDMIIFTSYPAIEDMSEITILTWIQPNTAAEEGRIVHKGTSVPPPWRLEWRPDGNFIMFQRPRTTTTLNIRTNLSTFPVYATNKWLFVGAVSDINGANSDQKLYMGDLFSLAQPASTYTTQVVGAGSITSDVGANMGVGNNPVGGSANEFNGRIAWVGIWNRKLTQREIWAQQFFPHKTRGNVFFAQLGFSGKTTQKEWSGNKGSGTITGATISKHVPIRITR